jgi:hypothetical protein
MKENKWIRLLAYVTGLVNQELLLQNEYFAEKIAFCAHTCRPRMDRKLELLELAVIWDQGQARDNE